MLEDAKGRINTICDRLEHFVDAVCALGDLSDRSKAVIIGNGDTPEGIVESCMEFLRVCVREGFKDAVVSIKASNTVVMVRSVRLLCGDNFQCTDLTGLYPCGEGAGYAGGIMTAAVDGVRCAAALMQQYAPDKA